MSHFVNYAINFENKEHIEKALEELGYEIKENVHLNGWGTRTMLVDIAGIKPKQNEIGFVKSKQGDTYEVVADWMYVPQSSKVRDRLAQLNSKYKVMDALKKSRFTSKVTEKDGELVIVGTRS